MPEVSSSVIKLYWLFKILQDTVVDADIHDHPADAEGQPAADDHGNPADAQTNPTDSAQPETMEGDLYEDLQTVYHMRRAEDESWSEAVHNLQTMLGWVMERYTDRRTSVALPITINQWGVVPSSSFSDMAARVTAMKLKIGDNGQWTPDMINYVLTGKKTN